MHHEHLNLNVSETRTSSVKARELLGALSVRDKKKKFLKICYLKLQTITSSDIAAECSSKVAEHFIRFNLHKSC